MFNIREVEESALDSLAGDAQATIFNGVIENQANQEDYGAGSIKGLRLAVTIKPEGLIEMPPRITVLIIPAGMTVPTITSADQRKTNERFVWGEFHVLPYADPTTATVWFGTMVLKTARRFHSGDQFVIAVTNEDPNVAFGAAAVGFAYGKAYVTED